MFSVSDVAANYPRLVQMSSASQTHSDEPHRAGLHSGDRMSREEFHRMYVQMPEDFKAELIGGIVYVASPLKQPHGDTHTRLNTIFDVYRGNTPGLQVCDNTTVMLGTEDEVQPDLYLRILPEYGGQSKDTDDEYVEGAPELVAEIAHSSRSIDLHFKRERYARAGVLEYIVICLEPKDFRWFDLRNGQEFTADTEGVFQSLVFPGLWIHDEAVLQLDYQRALDVLNQGLAKAEHQSFVAWLESKRQIG